MFPMFLCVRDKRLLTNNSNSATMTVQGLPEHSYDPEESFVRLYTGYVNGIPNSTREVQHARLTDVIENSKKEQDYLRETKKDQEILGKVKKVNRFGKND